VILLRTNKEEKVMTNNGDLDRDISELDQAIQLDPDDAEAYNNRGNAFRQNGDLERAIRDYDRAIQLNPNDAYAYINRGLAYARKRENEYAIADFQKVLELCGASPLCQAARQELEKLGVK
jgi:Flp pilus assembly protein TadD